jgi:starch phosphorylase
MANKKTAPSYEKPATDAASIKTAVASKLALGMGKEIGTASDRELYNALSQSVRDQLMARWLETQKAYKEAGAKKVYYLSLEFLIGRSLSNAMINIDAQDEAVKALKDMGTELELLRENEPDAGLGNGGLGRLAACFIDSMATLGLPGFGYSIRYDYGMFAQGVNDDGSQFERPDYWLRFQNQWEVKRDEVAYDIQFGGKVVTYQDDSGHTRYDWVDTEVVRAEAFDVPTPGNNGSTVNHLRLWSAKANDEFKLPYFNKGEYHEAVSEKNWSENISRVLYPEDSHQPGKDLRLKQQYFFVTASLQDILNDFIEEHGDLKKLPQKVAIQLNDTHPTVAIAELMRILLDIHHMSWAEAWDITRETFAYTCHTLLPEALETWPVSMFERLLPRHLDIIYAINHHFLEELKEKFGADDPRIPAMSIIGEDGERRVRMANLAVVGSHKVNGVAALHSQLMQEITFKDFHEFYPGKFTNVTNGVTPRRWIKECNPELAALITKKIGRDWENNLPELAKLEKLASQKTFRNQFAKIKLNNKKRLAALIKERTGVEVNPDTLFDVQVKRFHEYKRQHLNILHVIHRYNQIRKNPDQDFVPRTVIFGGKAAPGYVMAKRMIKLLNRVAEVVNNDPVVGDKLKVVLIPNYNVSPAQIIMPAADLSEQISTAGMEASGTGNMKLALNGALTIGTLDGANVEIAEEVGDDNIFIFGMTADEVEAERAKGYRPSQIAAENKDLAEVLDLIANGFFAPENPHEFKPLVDTLVGDNEHFLVLADFASYVDAQNRVDDQYRDKEEWMRKAILNTALCGKFSSDRSIQDYADNIWNVKPVLPKAK